MLAMASAPGAAVRAVASLRELVALAPVARLLATASVALGTPVYLVGGCVRDWLLGREPLDWDVVVPGEPAALLAWLRREARVRGSVVLDPELAIHRVLLADGGVIDVARMTDDNMRADLTRRDLTINAMAVDTAGNLIDPLSGYADLCAALVRAPSRGNLEADPVRLLRTFRFAASLGFTLDPATRGWVEDLAPLIARPAGERLLQEWHKLLAAPACHPHLAAMGAAGLLGPALGVAAGDLPEGRARLAALDAWLTEAVGPAWRRLAAWLAEPVTGDRPRRTTLALTVLSLDAGAAGPGPVGDRLRWSRREQRLAEVWAATAERLEALLREGRPPRGWHRLCRDAGEALPALPALVASRAPDLRGPAGEALAACWERLDQPLPRHLNGRDVMAALGIPPGPPVAELLAALEEETALGTVTDRESALHWARMAWRSGVHDGREPTSS
ncbi:MAG: hypothetical protein VKS61_15790 [Candidatus Sericytochromatia bacterium]|nr:hypothetical protein [Candidatus Sericytochromatia bacterium]